MSRSSPRWWEELPVGRKNLILGPALLPLLLAFGCGDGGSVSGTTTTGSTPETWPVDPGRGEPTEMRQSTGSDPFEAARQADLPEPTEVPGPPENQPGAPDAATALADIDGCSLVTAGEWETVLGEAAPPPAPVEDGEACSFADEADTVRAAVAWIASRSPDSELPTSLGASPVDLAGQLGLFAAEYPEDGSGTLSVVLPTGTLLVEVGSRNELSDDELKRIASELGVLALGRLPR
jgi:hypothetical protein